jgi:DNA replication protein DnaC
VLSEQSRAPIAIGRDGVSSHSQDFFGSFLHRLAKRDIKKIIFKKFVKTTLMPTNQLDINKYFIIIESTGQKLYSKNFHLYDDDHEIITKLLSYFLNDEELSKKYNISLNKGIMLIGPVGCGKTSLMSIFRLLNDPEERFILKSCRDVTFEFIKDGYETIFKYSKQSFKYDNPKTYCFDDLGTENSLKYYGNECNVMAEILLSRYDLFINRQMKTHLTTNLNSEEIEEIYGVRVRSRLREQFNLIAFDKSAKDKRI